MDVLLALGWVTLDVLASGSQLAATIPKNQVSGLWVCIFPKRQEGFVALFCLGVPLARLETKIALEEIFRRLHSLSRREKAVTRVDSFFLRGLKTLPLMFNTA